MERKIQVLKALVEGNSIRSIERMTGTHRDTVMRLLVKTGDDCQRKVLDKYVHGFHSKLIQVDEIWTFVRKKERRLTPEEQTNLELGDQFVFVGLDAETKLVPAFTIGKRNGQTAIKFMRELKYRLAGNGRIQITTDAFRSYRWAVREAFGHDVDYAQLSKIFGPTTPGYGRYSPPKVWGVLSTIINGNPDARFVSTSYIERQNLTMRMQMRRFTRLTNAFSKKLENLKAALSLHFAYYNFMRVHRTLGMTPAMKAGISNHVWTWEELLSFGAN
ncbi:MAG: IS1 family transposase [Candidatus Brocadiales bacterium]|nr:IS1 family transposase [Candidatus Bathyanammoxibius amoris]